MFQVDRTHLKELLTDSQGGKLQLPDFQRSWVWDDERIKGILASVSLGFPIGVIMTLEAGSGIKFESRPIKGVKLNGTDPGDYLLDGQQRITSLYQATFCKEPVETKNNRNQEKRLHYYIDMEKALDSNMDREDAILSVPENRIITRNFRREIDLDLSAPEKEYEARLFPADQIFNDSYWMLGFIGYWNGRDDDIQYDAVERYTKFKDTVIENFQKYLLPVIRMTKETPREAVCTVFEKVNTGGVVLTVFELVTASFAAEREGFSLRDDWERRLGNMSEKYDTLKNVTPDQFLQAIALLATQKKRRNRLADGVPKNDAPGVACKRRDILNLSLAEYDEWADQVEEGLIKAAKFLRRLCIYMDRDIPYRTQLVPLAALYVEMGAELDSANAVNRLKRWFWCGVFNESYGGTTETQFGRDLREIPDYIRGGSEPTLIREANFIPERLLSLRMRRSAAYKGLFALQMNNGAADWRTANTIANTMQEEGNVDIHHIFPRAWFKKNCPDVSSKIVDSTVNKTAIDATTNRKIGGSAPSAYLARLADKDINPTALDDVLSKHWIDPECLKADNFALFFVKRGQALLDLIGNAMGKNLGDGTEAFRRAVNEANYTDDYIDDPDD